MDNKIQTKTDNLIHNTRVMSLAVSDHDIPWSSPVYFVFHNNGFYFFSNENSSHIKYAKDKKILSASIFHDSDRMDMIFGFQMSGTLEKISKMSLYFTVVKKYVAKFNFLEQVFGSDILQNKRFFLEKFKSHLYCFHPEKIFLSDNSKTTDKRSPVDLNKLLS
jgi:hypothetical protein